MAKIYDIKAREILDSRGLPTVEVLVQADDIAKTEVRASVPAGTSVGKNEAYELRDNDSKRFAGMGVEQAVAKIEQVIAPSLRGEPLDDVKRLDQAIIDLDGTINKSNLGANSVLAVSIGLWKLAAAVVKMPFYRYLGTRMGIAPDKYRIPTVLFNVINGGKHGGGNLDFQEYFIIPSSQKTFSQALEMGVAVYQSLKKQFLDKGLSSAVGLEGGFAPKLFSTVDAFEALIQAIDNAGYVYNTDIFLGADAAANSFYKKDLYDVSGQSEPLAAKKLINFYVELNSRYHLQIIEDPLQENDFETWSELLLAIGDQTLVVGDDLVCTNINRIKKAIESKSCNAVVIKPNQVGTISETLDAIKLAKSVNWRVVVSHRSGETNDSYIADLAVAVEADYVKFGAPSRGERVAKYNRLWEIEKEI